MSTQTQTIENAPTAPPPQVARWLSGLRASARLRGEVARAHARTRGVSHWLKDNHALLQSQIADLRHTLRPSFLRNLHQTSEGEPRIYRIVAAWLANAPGVIDNDVLLPFAETLERDPASRYRRAVGLRADAEIRHRRAAVREFG